MTRFSYKNFSSTMYSITYLTKFTQNTFSGLFLQEDLNSQQSNAASDNGLLQLLSGNNDFFCVSSRNNLESSITKPFIFPNVYHI